MQSIQLFELASRQAEWLTVRQSVVSANVANVNTPAFKAQDVTPFEFVLQNSAMPMAATNKMHFTDSATDSFVVQSEDTNAAGQLSGNSVELSEELMKEGMIKRDYDLNTGLVKAFHSMMLLAVRRG